MSEPLNEEELKRLNERASGWVASFPKMLECPECAIEFLLVVRAVEQIRHHTEDDKSVKVGDISGCLYPAPCSCCGTLEWTPEQWANHRGGRGESPELRR
jgi:hypothetical protein